MKLRLLLIAIFIGTMGLFAQDPDTLDVPPLYTDWEGNPNQPALAHYIVADTLENGERKNPNRVYRLERYKDAQNQGIYVLDYGMDIDFSLRLVAEEGDGRPPLIVPEYTSTGGVLGYHFKLIGDSDTHVFKNIFFQRVNLDRAFTSDFLKGILFDGDSLRVEVEGCVFNAFTGNALQFTGQHNSIFIKDCVFRNGEWPSLPWIGQQNYFGNGNRIDTLVFTNNTYFNNNSYWLLHEGHVADYVVFEHNTIMTSAIDALHMRLLVNANIRSNLFYGYAAYGDTDHARTSGSWYEADGDSLAIISLDALGRIASNWGDVEENRTINVTHNAYYTPQALQDYYADYANYDPPHSDVDPVTAPLWMNLRTQSMFDDDAGYPYLIEEANLAEVDPQFADTEMDTWVTGAVAQYCRDLRETSTTDGWGTSVHRNYDAYLGDDICTGIQWPLPEGALEITNAAMLTAGHDGLPIGNLNWDPASRAKYRAPYEPPLGIKEFGEDYTPEFKLYPNPVRDMLTIHAPERIESVEVYSITGAKQILQTVSGDSTVQIDLSALSEGIYLVRLSTSRGTATELFMKH
ncbi:MAG: T9SS type A sorting domain-containing protein [Bacteroidota bacterium]